MVGQSDIVRDVLICIVAGGHALIEGVPGLGKTRLVRTLAETLDLEFSRIQFTPDLMPADITGTNILVEDEQGRRQFAFQRGPVFANLVLADEINRATPKTQSALLEAMQDKTVTVSNRVHTLEPPFFVLATRTRSRWRGTYPLPEAQARPLLLQADRAVSRCRRPQGDPPPDHRQPGHHAEHAADGRGHRGMGDSRATCRSRSTSRTSVVRLLLATHPENDDSPEVVKKVRPGRASPRGGQAIVSLEDSGALGRPLNVP
jgi:MoxR-like ATPase